MLLNICTEAADALKAKDAEIARLNEWADGFSDCQLKERATGEEYQRELKTKIKRMDAVVEAARKHMCSEFVDAYDGLCEICDTLAALDQKT